MDPLWSETCWSTFKYFMVLIVFTYYILRISWLIKCLITTTKLMHFRMESQLLAKPENWLTGNWNGIQIVPSSFSTSKQTSIGTVQSPSDGNYHLRYQHNRPLPQDQGPFSHRVREEDKMYGYCKQNSAMAHTVTDLKAFSKGLVRGPLQPPRDPPVECMQL